VPTRRTTVTALVVVAALVLAGCGGGSGSSDSGAGGSVVLAGRRVVTDARTETLAAETARMSATVDVDGRRLLEMEGVGNLRTGAGEFTMRNVLSNVEPSEEDVEMHVVGLDRSQAFLDLGGLLPLPPGKRWVGVTIDDPAARQLTGGADPSSGLDYLEGVADTVRETGRERVGGVETTRYALTVDLDSLVTRASDGIAAIDPLLAARYRALAAAVDAGAGDGAAWIDDDGRVRRLRFTFEFGGVASTTTFELSDFGVPVDVAAPPADEVVPFADVAGELTDVLGGAAPD
jgi:hypothetical protein